MEDTGYFKREDSKVEMLQVVSILGVTLVQEAWGKAWNSWADHGFPMLPVLFHAMQKHGKAWDAWEYFSGYSSRAWISMEFVGQDLLVI